jgi:hypothetical protein
LSSLLRQAGWLTLATGCWLLLSVSIGWYYTVTYFGRVGWPMPSVETVGALLLYYFSVLNVDTEIQAIHWVLVFPMAGFLWSLLLCEVARRSGHDTIPPRLRLASFIALASLPLSLPLPYMVLVAGETAEGWHWQRMLDVALRRGNVSPWSWLSPLYFALGVAAFALHAEVLRRSFQHSWLRLLRHTGLTAVAFVLVVALAGTAASYPLRWWLE